jgi:hypothetical protein
MIAIFIYTHVYIYIYINHTGEHAGVGRGQVSGHEGQLHACSFFGGERRVHV